MPQSCLLDQPLEPSPAVPAESRGLLPARAVHIRSRQAFQADGSAATECDAAATSPVDGLDWIETSLSTIDAGRPLASVVVSRGNRIAAVAALVVVRRAGIARRMLTGVGQLSEPMDLACVDEAARAALVQNLVRDGRPLWLERIAADSPTVALLHRAAKRAAA